MSMADIEVVIKIPEEIRLALINNIQLSIDQQSMCDSYIKHAIINGTPLSKGHGKIIDVNEAINYIDDYVFGFFSFDDVPAIIEADTESEDKE